MWRKYVPRHSCLFCKQRLATHSSCILSVAAVSIVIFCSYLDKFWWLEPWKSVFSSKKAYFYSGVHVFDYVIHEIVPYFCHIFGAAAAAAATACEATHLFFFMLMWLVLWWLIVVLYSVFIHVFVCLSRNGDETCPGSLVLQNAKTESNYNRSLAHKCRYLR